MAPELAWMTPLYCLLYLTKLDWRHFELPYNDHLIVATTSQMLTIGRESCNVDCRGVAALQIILVLWLIAYWSNTSCSLLTICCLRLLLIWHLLILSRRLHCCKVAIVSRYELPIADSRVELVDLGAGDEAA